MLRRDQVDLIQQEIDGANTPEGSAALRSLMEQDPEARAMAAELRRVATLFAQVAEREPPARLKRAILDALPQPARASPGALLRWAAQKLRLVSKPTEEAIMTRKAVLIGSAVVAIVIVVAGIITGFPPLGRDAGTIGGVEPAARYHGRVMTEADVSLKNPEIQALFQNDQILHLVRSDAFRQVMQNQAFHALMASDAYRQIAASQAYQQLMASQAYQQLMASQTYQQLMASQAFRDLQANAAYQQLMARQAFRDLQANAAYQQLMASQAYQQLMASQAFRDLQANAAYQQLMASQAYQQLMASQAFRDLQANAAYQQLMASQAYRDVVASQAFRDLQAHETFRALAQSRVLSQAFMREAMAIQQ
jgi:hypothetical protein